MGPQLLSDNRRLCREGQGGEGGSPRLQKRGPKNAKQSSLMSLRGERRGERVPLVKKYVMVGACESGSLVRIWFYLDSILPKSRESLMLAGRTSVSLTRRGVKKYLKE